MKVPKTFIPDTDLTKKLEELKEYDNKVPSIIMKIAEKEYDSLEQIHKDADFAIKSIYKKISDKNLSQEQKLAIRNLYWISFVYATKMLLFIQKQGYSKEEELEELLEVSLYSLKTIEELVKGGKKDENETT